MKKVLSLILALAMVFALAACGEKQPSNDGNTDGDKPARGNVIMTFGTADTGGSMYPAGAAVSQVWTNNVQGVKCNTQTSTGSFQNCQDVSTGEVDVAVATSDVVLNAYNGTGKFADIGKLDNLRVIGAVYTSVLSVPARPPRRRGAHHGNHPAGAGARQARCRRSCGLRDRERHPRRLWCHGH